jgi:hypothetical protein
MDETDDELENLQSLLDDSRAGATPHLRGIITDERALDASRLVALLTGMRLLSLASVTVRGEPRISALDGHFLHGRWLFSTDGSSAKARHLRARPAVSASYLPGEEIGVFTHGHVRFLEPDSPDFEPAIAHLTAHYGASPLSWGDDIVVCRIEPTWMVGFAA